jgi:hypothetical protein
MSVNDIMLRAFGSQLTDAEYRHVWNLVHGYLGTHPDDDEELDHDEHSPFEPRGIYWARENEHEGHPVPKPWTPSYTDRLTGLKMQRKYLPAAWKAGDPLPWQSMFDLFMRTVMERTQDSMMQILTDGIYGKSPLMQHVMAEEEPWASSGEET